MNISSWWCELCISMVVQYEGETRERALQGRKAAGSLAHIMNGRSVSLEVRKDLRNTVIVPTLTYARETWAWNECQGLECRQWK